MILFLKYICLPSPDFLVEKVLAAALYTALNALLIRILQHFSVIKWGL